MERSKRRVYPTIGRDGGSKGPLGLGRGVYPDGPGLRERRISTRRERAKHLDRLKDPGKMLRTIEAPAD